MAITRPNPTEFLPIVAWSAIARNVEMIDSSTYTLTVVPCNVNEPGGVTAAKGTDGFYIKDYAGDTFPVSAINVNGDWDRIEVKDAFESGYGPKVNFMCILYMSVDGGLSPFMAPINYDQLDKSALSNSRAKELDILWKNRGIATSEDANVTKIELGPGLTFAPSVDIGWEGGIAKTIKFNFDGTTDNFIVRNDDGGIHVSDFNANSFHKAIGDGERITGTHSGELHDMSLTDDYLYICVIGGDASIAKWKKVALFRNGVDRP